ncbi:MAG: hypothetical protein Tsb0020_51130 [Haliangiales bacterium]
MSGLDKRAEGLQKYFVGQLVEGRDRVFRVAMSLRNQDGRHIRCLLSSGGPEWRGLIIVVPGFGRTIRHSNALALAAASHGYAMIRFDPTDHVGDSDGEMLNATLTGVGKDLLFLFNTIREAGWRDGLFIAAASTFARSTVKMIQHGLSADGIVLTLPVVDFAKTLIAVTDIDLIGGYREQRIKPGDVVQLLTHELDAEFLADAIDNNFCGLETTRDELRAAPMPVAMIVAEGDDWVSLEDATAALEPGRPGRSLYVLENADHDSYSFGFIRAVTNTAMQVLAEMSGITLDSTYDFTFSKFASAVKTEKAILNQARKIWNAGNE